MDLKIRKTKLNLKNKRQNKDQKEMGHIIYVITLSKLEIMRSTKA